MTIGSAPKTLGKYILEEVVGSGGIGKVYRARNQKTGEIVALKILHDQYQSSKKLMGLFHKEIMIQGQVSHKNCVKFIEADLQPPRAYIVSSFVDGINCHNLIRQVGAVPPLIACCIMLDMLQGLEHLHCLDIIHSDITPSNVMIEKNGSVLLADFGLSCMSEFENYEGMTVGTPGYLSPERLQHKPMTPSADIYGAGVLFHEMLSGERLFFGKDPKETVYKMHHLKFDWVQSGNKDVDKKLREILSLALHIKPGKRYPTPRDFMYGTYLILKAFDIRYSRRAVLQFLVDKKLTELPPDSPKQRITI